MSNWGRGSTRGWRRNRALVLARDGYRCRVQIDGGKRCPVHPDKPCDVCTQRATCVHHVLGRGVTGDDPRHMVASCDECNLHVGDPTKQDPAPAPHSRWKDGAMVHEYDGPATLLVDGRELAVHAVLHTDATMEYLKSWGGTLTPPTDAEAQALASVLSLGLGQLRLPDGRTGNVHIGGKILTTDQDTTDFSTKRYPDGPAWSSVEVEVVGSGPAPYTMDT